MSALDKSFYLKLIAKESKKTQTEESLITAQSSCNKIDNGVIFQAKFLDIDYEYMTVQNDRFLTFAKCEPEVTPKKALELAENGFFFVEDDMIQCNYCLQIFNDWMTWEDIEDEHETRVPSCPLIRNLDVENIVPIYKSIKDVPNRDYCGNFGPRDYVLPTLKGFQIGEEEDPK